MLDATNSPLVQKAPSGESVLLWLREDLRTDDHPALRAACAAAAEAGLSVVACWIREEAAQDADGTRLGPRPLGAAARWWVQESLGVLEAELRALGIPLLFARGDAREFIPALAGALGATAVHCTRRYRPASRALDREVQERLAGVGVAFREYPGFLLVEPEEVATSDGTPYRVFTPFAKRAMTLPVGAPLTPPPVQRWPEALSERIDDATARGLITDRSALGLLDPGPAWWDGTLAQYWEPGARAAKSALAEALERIDGYEEGRDRPGDRSATSRLSPRLRWGELSPRRVVHAVRAAEAAGELCASDAASWIRQLFWREFSWHLAAAHPSLEREPLRPEFQEFPFAPDPALETAWQRGHTGIPLVDAGMRELWQTGWMHNRVRMVAASFLVKQLLQPWWRGEAWFWDTLVDADEANNPVSWQWVAGCGADAAPYFRVFNPELQRTKFDADGSYVHRWLPEGEAVDPVVDLREARARALAAYRAMRES